MRRSKFSKSLLTAAERHKQLAKNWGISIGGVRQYPDYPAKPPPRKDRSFLGRMKSITYRRDENSEIYTHQFRGERPPELYQGPTGVLYLESGAYEVSKGWIEQSKNEKRRWQKIPRYLLRVGEIVQIENDHGRTMNFRRGEQVLAVDRYNRAHFVAQTW